MPTQFGKTWWGEHWLRSLANVDYGNRLPRGLSYARNGHVVSIKIKENTITAKVQGTRATPYKVTIVVPPFSETQIERLMDRLVQRPALISKLLNRELDPEILSIAERLGLKVFPKQWTDFNMSCSCPDWAVPCKHLAAVIYMVSREIDNNPFLVFEMHQVNLMEELKKRGIFIEEQKKNEIPLLRNLVITKRKTSKTADENLAYERVDFSQLHDIAAPLVQLLPAAPVFYTGGGDFREKYAAQLLRITKEAKRLLNKKRDFATVFPSFHADKVLNHRVQLHFNIDGNNEVVVLLDEKDSIKMPALLSAIFALNQDYLPDFQPSVAGLHTLLFSAVHLAANGNMVPQLVQLDNKNFIVRWIPALIDAPVRNLVRKLQEILPANLLRTTSIVRKKEQIGEVENQAFELLSVLLSMLVKALSKDTSDNLFEDIFFKGKSHAFDGVGESALSGGIKVWLDRYYLAADTYKPLITVTDLENGTFEVSISIQDETKTDTLPIPLTKILENKKFEKQRFKILQTLSLLTPFIHGLDVHINGGGEEPIIYNTEDFAPFLMEVLPAIRLLNVPVQLPKSLQELLRPKVSMQLKRKNKTTGFIRLDDLLDFDWQVALGDTIMSEDEFNTLMRNAHSLFRFKERYIYVNEADLAKLHKAITDTKPLSPSRLLQIALSETYEGAPVILTDEVRDMMAELTAMSDIPLPQGLNATLRPYQQRGYSWMYRNSRIGFGSIIADDMGLGKTLQVISILLKFKEEQAINQKHKALVVVPTGLLINWQSEIERFAPSLSTFIFHGQARNIKDFDADVMLTTYGILRSDNELLKKQKWQVMVIDEAQNIKNYDTAQSKAAKSIPAQVRIAMSGTPVENRLSEFWSIMDYTNKGYLGNINAFNHDFASPIQVYNDEEVVRKFRKITAPFMMRRMKTDKSIISDLPDKVEQNQFALLTKQQAALYEQTMQAAMQEIEGVEGTDSQTLFKREGLILQMIMALKQICNHPTNFLKNNNLDASLSGKVQLLLELLDSIVSAGEKVLIFTQFKEMGTLLETFITEHFGDKPMFYHGGCSLPQRQEMVERFQNNRADKIFILSLKAAGTGLNLTEASHVIHFDLWWNPAVENQATDRAYRIGQKKNVMVHRLITKNTFEEKIDAMIQQKKHLAEMTVATGENWIGKLSNKELREIFTMNKQKP